ncbi:Protein ATP1B4, partial [Lamprotornis superbus]
ENKHEEKVQNPDREKDEPKADMGSKTWADLAGEMKIFLWNPEERTCLGRTAKSWGLILLFYFIFYTCLAGMFAFCLYVMLLTLSPYTPRFRDRVSPPGVMIRPYLNGFTIAFNVSQPNTWQPYVDSMHHFLAAYDDKVQEEKNIKCVPGKYFIQGGNDSEVKKACRFKRSLLQNCSGIEDPTFGYSKGQPCILLKMNRIIGYRPGAGVPVSVDCKVQAANCNPGHAFIAPLFPGWKQGSGWVHIKHSTAELSQGLARDICSETSSEGSCILCPMSYKGNESHLRSVDFYPGNGTFDLMYYPYYGKFTHVNYTSPLVAMHFTDVQKNYSVPIQCSLNGKGIINDLNSDRFLGRIIFTLSIGKSKSGSLGKGKEQGRRATEVELGDRLYRLIASTTFSSSNDVRYKDKNDKESKCHAHCDGNKKVQKGDGFSTHHTMALLQGIPRVKNGLRFHTRNIPSLLALIYPGSTQSVKPFGLHCYPAGRYKEQQLAARGTELITFITNSYIPPSFEKAKS